MNLDAMIKRADFAISAVEDQFDKIGSISLRDFTDGGMLGSILRKPDFQRETNHWNPSQVASLLECFLSGDLIPSVILWKSPTHLFVIDGGHRLSVLKAWIKDDYGDGPASVAFFGSDIPLQQKKAAQQTRKIINDKIGSWQHIQAKAKESNLSPEDQAMMNTIITRTLQIQWVTGDAEKAQASFFKINTQGTPLDDIEELLLKNRRKSIPIAARAIIRAGMGNKYWSGFSKPNALKIEEYARNIHALLFDPEIRNPIKTLDLPLGGAKGIRTALQVLIDFMLIATRDHAGNPKDLTSTVDDDDGSATIEALKRTTLILNRITGNDGGSLGLHPAVYFYGPTGRHSGPMFMGTIELVGKNIRNNNKDFFRKFTTVRSRLEKILVVNKDLIATISQKHVSKKRVAAHTAFLEQLIELLANDKKVNEGKLVEISGLEGKIVHGQGTTEGKKFSDDTKSQTFISTALHAAVKCSICGGYLDPNKSVSYDHKVPAREKGRGTAENCQIVHPYCNQSVKQ